MKKTILTIAFLIGIINLSIANNIEITNLSLTGQNPAQNFYLVEFDISWENSWRTSTHESNWDAAWVFVKFSLKKDHDFGHATLHYVNGTAAADGHTQPAGSTITTPSDGKGIFIHRSADGIGNVNWQNVQLRWDYGVDGISDNDILEIRVFGIEMVYVPQGQFYLGDGGTGFAQFETGTSGNPYLVTSENQITLGGGAATSLGNNNGGNGDDFDDVTSRTLPAAFPKGFNAFYCMKYETSNQQYADFLSCLTPVQRQARDDNMVDFERVGDYYAIPEFPFCAVEEVSWLDMATYLDWTALRPMSEMEYEKACRGPEQARNNEHAWGTNRVFTGLEIDDYYNIYEGTDSAFIDPRGISQHIGNINTNSAYYGLFRLTRTGIFAASAINKTRVETGATYWGIMEMSGNAYESVISVGNSQSRDFSGLHGNGSITSSGNASFNVLTDWAFANAVGIGIRRNIISSRSRTIVNSLYPTNFGIRGVRTAP